MLIINHQVFLVAVLELLIRFDKCIKCYKNGCFNSWIHGRYQAKLCRQRLLYVLSLSSSTDREIVNTC